MKNRDWKESRAGSFFPFSWRIDTVSSFVVGTSANVCMDHSTVVFYATRATRASRDTKLPHVGG